MSLSSNFRNQDETHENALTDYSFHQDSIARLGVAGHVSVPILEHAGRVRLEYPGMQAVVSEFLLAEKNIGGIFHEEPKPRIVQFNKRRYSVRLESVFWRTLEGAAQARGQRLGKLVAELAAGPEN